MRNLHVEAATEKQISSSLSWKWNQCSLAETYILPNEKSGLESFSFSNGTIVCILSYAFYTFFIRRLNKSFNLKVLYEKEMTTTIQFSCLIVLHNHSSSERSFRYVSELSNYRALKIMTEQHIINNFGL